MGGEGTVSPSRGVAALDVDELLGPGGQGGDRHVGAKAGPPVQPDGHALETPATRHHERGRVGERYILGDHNVSYREFFQLVARVAGVREPTRRLPRWLALGAGWGMEHSARLRGKPPQTTYRATRYATRYLYYDVSKARRELGLPSTPLEQTVERAVRWFRDNGYA